MGSVVLMGGPMPTSLFQIFAISLAGVATAATSQTSTQIAADNAKKESAIAAKDRLVAEKDKINAEADLARARITSLGLPTFEGKTTLKDNAGKIEAMMLASDALGGAVTLIAKDLKAKTASTNEAGQAVPLPSYIVLAGDEVLDFSVSESMALEVRIVSDLLVTALGEQASSTGDIAGGVAGISAIAGLLRSETEVSAIDLTTSLPNRLLAAAVARQVGGVLPSALIRAPFEDAREPADSLAKSWNALLALAKQAAATRKAMGEKPKDKAKVARLDQGLARFKLLFDQLTTANEKGVAPITYAIRLDRLGRQDRKILRVYAEYSGGTFVSSKNLATMVGFDPMKVSGGIIVSYTVTDPTSGAVEGHHIISCRTALTSLRRVQVGNWSRVGITNDQRCKQII